MWGGFARSAGVDRVGLGEWFGKGQVMDGRCSCGAVRFKISASPIVTHACHCTSCQTASGSAFAMNAIVETSEIEVLAGRLSERCLPTHSGKGQFAQQCDECGVTLWSFFAGMGSGLAFVRVGTLLPGHGVTPDVHIYTASKQPWVPIPEGARQFDGFYNPPELWGPDGLARYQAAREAQ